MPLKMTFNGDNLYKRAAFSEVVKSKRQLAMAMGISYPTILKITAKKYKNVSFNLIAEFVARTIGLETFLDMKVRDFFTITKE